jgi:RNA-directed DNA polymerase
MLEDLKDRLARFGLQLHEEKTRLIEFGRFAAMTRRKRDERDQRASPSQPHYCGQPRDGRLIVKHKTQSNRLRRELKALRQEAQLMHRPLAEQHRWYASVLRGHYAYFGMPHNWKALNRFYREVRRNCLRRRSQKNRRVGRNWFEEVTSCLPLPRPRITHPWTSRAV